MAVAEAAAVVSVMVAVRLPPAAVDPRQPRHAARQGDGVGRDARHEEAAQVGVGVDGGL
jgi:hypothetical protein